MELGKPPEPIFFGRKIVSEEEVNLMLFLYDSKAILFIIHSKYFPVSDWLKPHS